MTSGVLLADCDAAKSSVVIKAAVYRNLWVLQGHLKHGVQSQTSPRRVFVRDGPPRASMFPSL